MPGTETDDELWERIKRTIPNEPPPETFLESPDSTEIFVEPPEIKENQIKVIGHNNVTRWMLLFIHPYAVAVNFRHVKAVIKSEHGYTEYALDGQTWADRAIDLINYLSSPGMLRAKWFSVGSKEGIRMASEFSRCQKFTLRATTQLEIKGLPNERK